jgi:hypothetical protein
MPMTVGGMNVDIDESSFVEEERKSPQKSVRFT